LNSSKRNTADEINWNNLTGYPAACPANNFMTQVGDTITCTSVQATIVSLAVGGNLTVNGYINDSKGSLERYNDSARIDAVNTAINTERDARIGNDSLKANLSGANFTGIVNAPSVVFGSGLMPILNTTTNRPLSSTANRVMYVCDSGCEFTTINSALVQVPLILYHQYDIRIRITDNYTANEDVIIPYTIGAAKSINEGTNVLYILGNEGNNTVGHAKIKSLVVSGGTGTGNPSIHGFNISEVNDYDDEGAAIELYGTQRAYIDEMLISGTQTYGIILYNSGASIKHIDLGNCRVTNGIGTKHGGILYDDTDGQSAMLTGNVTNYVLVASGGGVSFSIFNNLTATGNCSGTLTLSGTEPLSNTAQIHAVNGLINNVQTRTIYGIENIPNLLTVNGLTSNNNITAINGFMNINWSYLQNIPSYVKDWSASPTFTGTVNINANLVVDSNILYVDTSTDKVCINCTNPRSQFDIRSKNNNTVNTFAISKPDATNDYIQMGSVGDDGRIRVIDGAGNVDIYLGANLISTFANGIDVEGLSYIGDWQISGVGSTTDTFVSAGQASIGTGGNFLMDIDSFGAFLIRNSSDAQLFNANPYTSTVVINGLTTSTEFSGAQNWTDNKNYPASCPGTGGSQTYVTTINDSTTCTGVSGLNQSNINDIYVLNTGDTLTGNINMNGFNITGINTLGDNSTSTGITVIDNISMGINCIKFSTGGSICG
jgi:hypothetical protein